MATATLKLYSDCRIIKGKNLVVDHIEDYLATLPVTTVENFQYQRFDIKKTIVLKLDQVWQTKKENLPYNDATVAKKWNYLKIINLVDSSEIIYYYFITGYKQLAVDAVELSLEMDTINTFKYSQVYDYTNSTYTLTDKTRVKREHKNRFTRLDSTVRLVTTTQEEKDYGLDWMDGGALYANTPIYNLDLGQILPRIGSNSTGMYYSPDNEAGIKVYIDGLLEVYAHSMLIGPTNIYFGDKNGDDVLIIEFYNWDFNKKIGIAGVPVVDSVDFNYMGDSNIWVDLIPIITAEKQLKGLIFSKEIDKYDEKINPILFKTSEEYLYDADGENTWYVVYASENAVTADADSTDAKYINPVKVQFASDLGYTLTTSSSTAKSFGPQDAQIPDVKNTREYLKIKRDDFEDDNAYIQVGSTKYYRTGLTGQNVYYIERKGNNDVLFSRLLRGTIGTVTTLASNFGSITVYGINSCTIQSSWDIGNPLYAAFYEGTFYFGTGTSTVEASGGEWNTMNLSDPQLIKAINYPYSPIDFLVDNREITSYPESLIWNSSKNLLQLTSPQDNFFRKITFAKNPFKDVALVSPNFSYGQPRNIQYEPKLLNSSFSYDKFVYDSYSFPFRLEYLDVETYLDTWGANNDSFYVNYACSNSILSKFYFEFPQYVCNYETQDYNNLLIVERNNEKALYNNAFINYIKSGGYNHDTNKAVTQNTINGITTALSLAGAIASFASAGVTGGAGIAAGIGLTATAFGGIARTINNANEQDVAISQKINQSALQGTSVIGGGDVSLFKAYGKNKAKMVHYEPSEVMKNALWDLFYYCGYATFEQKIPNVNTRTYFNFVQAEIEFKLYNFNNDIAEDIKNKWNEGITFLHKVGTTWDFDQQYENWEVSLMN